MKSPSVALLLLLAIALPGCKNTDATVTGTVSYRERVGLPADAVVWVGIEDVSRADAPATLIVSTEIRPEGKQPPIPFTLTPADPKGLDPHGTYALRARITGADGALLWTNDTRYAVITNGVVKADMILKRVAAD